MGDSQVKNVWNADLYDEKHSFVSAFGRGIVEILDAQEGERILDLGCGTGELANQLHQTGVHIVGMDKSGEMVAKAQAKYPYISFQTGDAAALPFQEEFDAVFSNATLHWVKPPKQALQGIYRSLRHGGRFVAEFGGKGNVQIITDEMVRQLEAAGTALEKEQFPWYFPSIGEYTALMEEAGFQVVFAQHFDRPTPLDGEEGLCNWIHMFAGGMLEHLNPEAKEQVIAKVEEQLKSVLFTKDGWVADYKRIRVVGIK
ncbi:class I SAM-dependent methyltransferase [Ectobacillus ponti]|uniref:Methyltransferase domain-containing protein n=1 Tax=Ectobacillus ponti TaxID=2961894 RepID=A0AA41XDG0_9BACI|nr:class I SAM-dependent methyltransferase [Ectobacillus ponti]MCP8970081.1 methyltransferase domain-containing protein [Ectobacillus ponti]